MIPARYTLPPAKGREVVWWLPFGIGSCGDRPGSLLAFEGPFVAIHRAA